jgi:DNA-binding HxlR family transcriptional regulator
MSTRTYNQYCGLAYALEIVGERWTLLIVRELMPGPRRFKDLQEGLPGISTNLLAERLKVLEGQELIRQRTLPPPAASRVYELTPLGKSLERTLLELGKWGSRFVPDSMDGVQVLGPNSYALTLKTFFRPDRAEGLRESYELNIEDEVLGVRIADGGIEVSAGEVPEAHLTLHTDVATFLGLLAGNIKPDEARSRGIMHTEGDPAALDRLLEICRIEAPS